MLCAAKIIDRHLGEQKLLEMAAFLYAGRFDAYVSNTISVIIEAPFFPHLLDGRSITQNGRWITKKVDYREIYQKVPKRIDRWKLVRLLKKNHCCTQMRWNYGTNDFVLPDNQHSR